MYRKVFRDKFAEDLLSDYCLDKGLGQKKRIQIAMESCNVMTTQVEIAYAVLQYHQRFKTHRQRYALTLITLFGTIYDLFEDINKSGNDISEFWGIFLSCALILHDSLNDKIKNEMYPGINFEPTIVNNKLEFPKISKDVVVLIHELNKKNKKTIEVMERTTTTGRHIKICNSLKSKYPNENKFYDEYINAGSYLKKDISVDFMLATIFKYEDVNVDF